MFGCWKRILPSSESEEFQSFSKAKYLFEKILNKLGQKQMSLTAFGKISKIKVLKNKVTRVSLDLLYKRITQLNGVNTMDLSIFFDAMEEISFQLFPGQLGKCDAVIDLLLENILEMLPAATKVNKSYMKETGNSRRP